MKVTINKDGETTVEGSFNEVQGILQDLGYFDTTSSQEREDTARYTFVVETKRGVTPEDSCSITLTGCKARFDGRPLNFGGFPNECRCGLREQKPTFHGQVFTDEGAAIPVTYGNGVSFAEAAEKALKEHQDKQNAKEIAKVIMEPYHEATRQGGWLYVP